MMAECRNCRKARRLLAEVLAEFASNVYVKAEPSNPDGSEDTRWMREAQDWMTQTAEPDECTHAPTYAELVAALEAEREHKLEIITHYRTMQEYANEHIRELLALALEERQLRWEADEALQDIDATLCACRYDNKAGCNCDIHAAHAIARAALTNQGDQP